MSQLNRYLTALSLEADLPKFDLLNLMIAKHMAMFSFNNIDLLLNKGQILSLKTEDVYNKIVTNGRGGYCFEHNKLFYVMTQHLELETSAHLARVTFNKQEATPLTHRITIVTLDGQEYLADVGFGRYAPTCLVPLTGAAVTGVNGEVFRIMKNKTDYALETIKNGAFFALYVFEKNRCLEIDFELANYYTNCHPDSGFTKNLVVARIYDNQTIVIRENIYSIIESGIATQIEINSPQDLQMKLSQKFAIEILDEQAEILF